MACFDVPCVERLHIPKVTTYREPDSLYSWVVLACAFAIVWLVGGIGFSFGVVLPQFITEFNESRQNGALIGSIGIAFTLGESLLSSHLCMRYSCRLIAALGHVLCAAGFLLSSTAPSLPVLFVTHSFLVGSGTCFIVSPSFLICERYFKKRRSLAIGAISAGVGLGVMTWGPLSQQIINRLGWRGFYRLTAGLFAGSIFLTLSFDPRIGKRPEPDAEAPARRGLLEILRDLSAWKYRPYTLSVISVCIASFGHYSVIIHLMKFSSDEIGLSADKASRLYIASGMATVFARLVAGRICDLRSVRPIYVNLIAELCSGVVTLCSPLASSYTHLIILIACYGLADGAFRTTINILFMQTAKPDPVKVASAYGGGMMMTAIPTAAGPALAGMLADRSGSYRVAFFVSGGITLLSTLAYLPEIYKDIQVICKAKQQGPEDRLDSVFDNPTCTDYEVTPL
ncbi:predicted protein [Nematostella vectensis]|uniref:Major facilitator superfamily (MFS) profile domain-containing protein n=1 Tax=Nematostella vectensis TaxID=45351 RepID=A7RJ56_NEMVE|nr:predicted protein [Nematostella vectensis]|eukprot:XP_001640583.1 predicted protein [Nematostella vectensis]